MTIKLILKDEVNIKLEGLSVMYRKDLHNKFKYVIPHAKYSPAYKLGRWDGTISLFSMNGDGFMSQLDRILQYLDQHKIIDIDIEDHRKVYDLTFKPVTEQFWSDHGITWPDSHQHAGKPIVLRDYQVEAINKFLKTPQSLQELATSSGKTIITATLAKCVESLGRTITIVPNKSLIEQTAEDFRNVQLDVGVYYGDKKELGKTHTICTWQSLEILNKKSKKNIGDEYILVDFLKNVKTVIVDECHRADATVLRNLLTKQLANAPIRWGLTGTIPKEEHSYESIHASIGPMFKTIEAHVLQERGVLSNCHVNILQMIDTKSFLQYSSELTYLTTTPERLEYIANIIIDIAKNGNTFILVDRIKSGDMLTQILKNKGIEAVFVSGSVKTKTRKQQYDDINLADNKVVIATYGVASTGINIPRIFNLVLIEPGKSFTRVIQSIGRGLRKAHDKDSVAIYDFSSTCKFSKRHLTQRKQFYRQAKYPFSIKKLDWE